MIAIPDVHVPMPSTVTRSATSVRGWRQVREVGSAWGMWIVARLAMGLGRRPAQALLRLVVLYYFLFHAAARRRSREFLERVGVAAGWRPVYRHFLRFAECTLDRLFFLRGEVGALEFHQHGHDHLADLAHRGRGAILLGAHLGSFESLRYLGQARDLPLHIVMDVRNAVRVQSLLARLGRPERLRFIDAGASVVHVALEVRAAVQRGELVAILADRVSGPRTVAAPFLGRQAYFPAGPFLVAAALRCPVYLAFGLYFAPRRYELYCEPLAAAIHLPRAGRDVALAEVVAAYAARLEHYCRMAPDNWFNFFDFFSPPLLPPASPTPPSSSP
jgi:predicted LPLAT superfamily acyltransferase